MVSFASSFDTPGVLARSVRDAALVANHMSGVDGVDSTCVMEATTFLPEPGGRLDNVRVGIPQEYHIAELSDGALAAWHQGVEWIEQQGGTAVPVSLPRTQEALATYYILTLAEASSNLARYDGMEFGLRPHAASEYDTVADMITDSRGASFGDEVRRRIIAGTFVLSRRSYVQVGCFPTSYAASVVNWRSDRPPVLCA